MDVCYWDAFERLRLDLNDLKHFQGSLVGFSGKEVYIKGYVTLKITFGAKENAKKIKVRYLVINVLSSYSMTIGRSAFNQLGATLSTLNICIKNLFPYGHVGVI